MNIYYNKIRFIKIWKWWKQLYNAFVKLYSIIMERDFGVRIHKGQNHFFFFLTVPVQMWNLIFFWSLTFSQFQSFVIVHLLLMYTDSKTSCRDDMAHASSWHILARAHHSFYLEKFGLQKAGRYDYTHPLQGKRAKTINRNCLPWGRAANKNLLLLLLRESVLNGETKENSN